MVIAGLSCLNMPLGTVLGIFTLIVLSRESVKVLFKGEATPQVPQGEQAPKIP